MILETKRLILRPPVLKDAKEIFEGFSNFNVRKHISPAPNPYTLNNSKEYIKSSIKNYKKTKIEKYNFILELKESKKVIGCVSLSIKWNNLVGSTGAWINESYWKKGYITEAKIAIHDFAFNKLKLRRIESSTQKENVASRTALQKLGFKKEGLKRKAVICNTTKKIHDECIFGLLKEDWKKARKKIKQEK